MTSSTSPSASRGHVGFGALRHMHARRRDEAHRTATPLELFFDLCFVVAVGQAGLQLVHAVAENHVADGVVGYLYVFFGIWWAWMNFTWFASAYDCDDVPYRIATLLAICGVLIYAAGVPRAFADNDWTITVIGYVVMRIALTAQWLRAAASEDRGPARRTALIYACGVALCQLGWISLLLAPADSRRWLFLILVAAELLVPVVAERRHQTPWHPHHIAERYGLFTIIVLGETMFATTVAVQSALGDVKEFSELAPIAGGGILIIFSAWWIYFAVPAHERLKSNRESIPWGYGHFLIFASAAAIGAGLEVAVEQSVGKAHIPTSTASAAVTVPTAIYLLTVWFLHARHFKETLAQQLVLPVAVPAVLLCTLAGHWAVLAAGLVAAATVATGVALASRTPEAKRASGTPPSEV
ncbi:low temperature requirement protein A [Streptomyces sp. WMMC940]|uniref:low temperature requirement protein A n=1 Tax=Streptomyces sp. WMMC940 TaxID=3015153 RepID=UPI0022B6EE8C|nr:low temperature requirement protein A [Streptomyces sp. WMMC940]MCZ7459731.1 low temperature requirement protein A [Streptomyces sp. WMMC940]